MSDESESVRAKVLIAEDDAIVALDLQGMVTRLGYDVVALVDSGQAALAAVKRFQPDIILLDIILNGPMDGVEVAKKIHEFRDIPVVFCISTPDLALLARAKEISYSGYLLKPINPDSLATTLDMSLYKYKLEKRVKQAEEGYRRLAARCRAINCLFDRNAAFEWTWKPDTGSALDGNVAAAGHPVAAIGEQLDSLMRARSGPQGDGCVSTIVLASGSDGSRLAYAVIGMRDDATGTVSGTLIPVAGGAVS